MKLTKQFLTTDEKTTDPILGRCITLFSFPPTVSKDQIVRNGDSRLLDDVDFDSITSKSDHTRWKNDVKDQPLRLSTRPTESDTAIITDSSYPFPSSSFFFSFFPKSTETKQKKDSNDLSTPPRKPMRRNSRRDAIQRPNVSKGQEQISLDSKKCYPMRKSTSCSQISVCPLRMSL